MKKILKIIYNKIGYFLNLFNRIIPFYIIFIRIFFKNINDGLVFYGAKISKNCRIEKLKLIRVLPINLEIHNYSKIGQLLIKTNDICLVEGGVNIRTLELDRPMIITKRKLYTGNQLKNMPTTFSFDVEKSPDGQINKNSFRALVDIFKDVKIPSVWAICGDLFDCFSEEIDDILKYDFFEIAYHTFGHYDYLKINKDTLLYDIKMADTLRVNYKIELTSFVFPFNNVNHIDVLSKKGNFKHFRGYIGGSTPQTVNFQDKFIYFNTTNFLHPKNIDYYLKNYKELFKVNLNFFSHPWNWRKKSDIDKLLDFMRIVKIGNNNIKKFNECSSF